MKKKSLKKTLSLNKSIISKIKTTQLKGGTGRCTNSLGCESAAECGPATQNPDYTMVPCTNGCTIGCPIN